MKKYIILMVISASLMFAMCGCAARDASRESEKISAETYDITFELECIEEQAAQLEEKYQSANSQADLTEASGDLYKLWDNELNALLDRLKEILSKEELSVLTEEEREWVSSRETDVKAAAAEYEGGSMYSMVCTRRASALTRMRVYELADYLSEKTGQAYEDNYSGTYVDRRGTETIDNGLYLKYLGAGTYDVMIGLGQLRTLEGIARADGNVLCFEDKEFQIKGTIAVENTRAVLTITESEWEEAAAGIGFEFPEKYEYSKHFSFADISGIEFWCGIGAWSTVLYVHEDGTFEGKYLDCDMGSSEYYLCDFEGKFTEPEQVNAYTWSVKIAALNLANEPGTKETREGWTYNYSEPYGLNDADHILLYLPGAPAAELPSEFTEWVYPNLSSTGTRAFLPLYGLYNVNSKKGFSSRNPAQ